MHQIVYPITAKLMHENKHDEMNVLYKKTSINLQMVGGYVMLGIFVNINKLYEMVPPEYAGGILVVFMIGLSKYFDLILGNNNAIIFNTKYYRTVLFLGVFLVILTVGLNMIFIPIAFCCKKIKSVSFYQSNPVFNSTYTSFISFILLLGVSV